MGTPRRVRWMHFKSVLAMMVAGGASASAQDVPLPAITPPPGWQNIERGPQTTVPSPAVGQMLQHLRLTPADIARLKAAPETPLAPGGQERPNDAQRNREAGTQTLPRSPTLSEQIEAIRRQPGGAEALDRARRGGARIPASTGGASPQASETSRVAVATVRDVPGGGELWTGEGSELTRRDVAPRALEPPVFQSGALKVTKAAQSAWTKGFGYIQATEHFPAVVSQYYYGAFEQIAYSTAGPLGSMEVRSYLNISGTVDSTGYYILNVLATPTAAELRHMSSTQCCPVPIVRGGQWDNTAMGSSSSYPPVWTLYPVVLFLRAGYHNFVWMPLGFGKRVMVSEVSLTKL